MRGLFHGHPVNFYGVTFLVPRHLAEWLIRKVIVFLQDDRLKNILSDLPHVTGIISYWPVARKPHQCPYRDFVLPLRLPGSSPGGR
jgi:hypothetical protein